MDKVRAFMKVAWAQRFWILSVVGVLAAVVCWMMASGELQRQFTANQTQIKSKFGEMTAITGKQFHGNEGVNAKEKTEAKKIAESVKELWQNLFDAQREEVLKWPDVLGNDFVDYVKNAKFDSNIKPLFRDRYQNYIKNRFEGLVKIVDAKKMPVDGTGFGGATGREGAFPGREAPGAEPMLDAMGMPIEENYLVQWADQAVLRQQLEFTGVPTSRQIWVTQEDLWVYETLLRAIANTNKERGATRPDNTAISAIQSLQVGAPAALAIAQESTILMPAEAMAMGGEMGMSPEAGMMGREGEMGAGGAESIDASLLMNRYIDAEGKPIPDASAGAGTEFRRLPIRMMLSMDERYLPKILVECANAPLPIEVQRLRINAEKSGVDKDNQGFVLGPAAGAGGMGEGRGGMGMPSSGGMGGGRGMPMGRGMEGGMGMPLTPVDIANMVTVDIQGIVYIYNPPDPAILTVPGDDAAATGSETLAAGDAGVVR
jgi:hypothetical protein